ncbi:Golgi membrane exchange factor (Ric1p-Rgp1p) subunit [Coemansia sp. Benny D160-2]|nr:Golgi membrane exchange factor (Ric1p-Rgp1p) subunit [Coemansia sp. Benny D160-2]
MSFASWFPFSGQSQQQQQQQQHQSSYPSPVAAPASEGGSSGLLSSLWRNLSGGSNLPPRPATRAGSVVEESTDVESLAIGFAEISGSLALASSYIKPDQMELLLAHKGTDYRTNRVIGSPPIGGGLGGRTPTGSSNTASGRSQKTLPLVMSLPTVLFSELALGPGESQTFSIRVQLPKSLPPSFRGKTARISYDLVVVAKKSMLESTAYVVRIPFRVLAYVGASGFTSAFPLARPLQMAPDHIKLAYQDEIAVCTPRNASPSFSSDKDEILQLGSASKSDSLGIEFLSPLADLGVSKEKEDIGDAFEQLKQSTGSAFNGTLQSKR